MNSIRTPQRRWTSPRTQPRSSGSWATLCAETLAGIADPLFPALTLAESVPPAQAARRVLSGLLAPLESPGADERLPGWLLGHQADAVQRARTILTRFGGVLIADGVGLGKTYIALALAALEREDGGDAVAIVPAALRQEWLRASREVGVHVRLHTHTELARRVPCLEGQVTLVLVDEAHAFRNPQTRRYDALARLVGGRRVALVSATPINNSAQDLAALIHLFAGRDRFREFGVPDLADALARGEIGSTALALGALTVCRSRRLVEARFPALRPAFPRRVLLPAVRYDLAASFGGHLGEVVSAAASLAASERHGGMLLSLSLLRRLESSRAAFRRSLLRHREFLREWRTARESGRALSRREFSAVFPRSDSDDSQLVLWPLLSCGSRVDADLDRETWQEAVERALDLVDQASAAPDSKVEVLAELLGGRLAGRKAIVFTEFRDTALHIARALRHRLRLLVVAGDAAWLGHERISRRQALDAFAPQARGARPNPLLEADVLIATDVASEGMNLQDACAVVNYDLPWNPVRVMQRVGRIDRLHSPHATISVAHLVPADGLHLLTGVLRTLRTKLMAVPATASAEPDPLSALWWIDQPAPGPESIERESWRRVEPFEARERWRAAVGPARCRDREPTAWVAAGLARDDELPALGILLALEWPGGCRIPLPFVLTEPGVVRCDAAALGALAERALGAQTIPSSPSDFSAALATVLPRARDLLVACSAVRRGTLAAGIGRSKALAALAGLARDAMRRRDAATADALSAATESLASELPVGVDRMLCRLPREGAEPAALAKGIVDIVGRSRPPSGPRLDGTPRLVLIAALALATRCPADS